MRRRRKKRKKRGKREKKEKKGKKEKEREGKRNLREFMRGGDGTRSVGESVAVYSPGSFLCHNF